jgi:transposase
MLGHKSFEDRPVFVSLESLVPKEDFLRKVDQVVDFSFIPGLVAELYSGIGRPSIDPIVVTKVLLVGFLYGIVSERRLMRDIQVNLSYRLFVGYNLDERLPDHSSLSKIRVRFGRETFQAIFDDIVRQCIQAGLVSGEHLSFDATLVAADASLSSMIPRMNVAQFTEEVFDNNTVECESSDTIDEETKSVHPGSQQDSSSLNAIHSETAKKKTKRGHPLSNATHVSQTDPDATLSKDRNSMMTLLSYKDNISTDSANRIVLDCVAITGCQDEATDVLDRLFRIHYKFGISPKEVSADMKYGTEKNFVGLEDHRMDAFIPVRKSGENTITGLYSLDKFTYDRKKDVMICPAGQEILPRPYLFQGKYRHFVADKDTCMACPQRDLCTRIGDRRKTGRSLSVSVNRDYTERAKQRMKTPRGKRAHNIRKTRVETIFGEGKTLHGLRRAKWRGIEKVHVQFLLTATAQNIKRMVKVLMKRKKAAQAAVAMSPLALNLCCIPVHNSEMLKARPIKQDRVL